jgi:hypothetical protein
VFNFRFSVSHRFPLCNFRVFQFHADLYAFFAQPSAEEIVRHPGVTPPNRALPSITQAGDTANGSPLYSDQKIFNNCSKVSISGSEPNTIEIDLVYHGALR